MDERTITEARRRLANAEQTAAAARLAFFTEVERAYRGGATLGQLGKLLGVSTQRVHQMIQVVRDTGRTA